MNEDENTPVDEPVENPPVEPETPTEEVEPDALTEWKDSPEFVALKAKLTELRILYPLNPHLAAMYTGAHNLV